MGRRRSLRWWDPPVYISQHQQKKHVVRTQATLLAPDLTTTSLNLHVICTDPQPLIEERPEAYKLIQAVVT